MSLLNKITGLLFLLTLCLFASCKKKDTAAPAAPAPAADPRDKIVGTYAMNDSSRIFVSQSSPSIRQPDSSVVYFEVLTISKDPSFADRIDMIEVDQNGNLKYYCSSVAQSGSDQILFNMPSQDAKSTYSSQYTLSGETTVTVNGQKYDGVYNTTTQNFKLGYKGTLKYTDNSVNYTIPIAGLKQGVRQ